MATMVSEIYDALLEAGASDEKARRAAEVISTHDLKLSDVRTELKQDIAALGQDLAAVRVELKQDIASVRQELAAVRSELKQDIAAVRSELKQDIAAVRSELKDVRTELKQDISSVKQEITDVRGDLRLLRWQVGGLTALLTALTAPTLWLLIRLAAKLGALPG